MSEENEDVKTGIREILLRLEPLVKVSGGNAPLESMMVYLEEIDDSHFEKYTMVRHIKSRLKTSLLELVSYFARFGLGLKNAGKLNNNIIIIFRYKQKFNFNVEILN